MDGQKIVYATLDSSKHIASIAGLVLLLDGVYDADWEGPVVTILGGDFSALDIYLVNDMPEVGSMRCRVQVINGAGFILKN